MAEPLQMWTIFDHPEDYPTGYIPRRFRTVKGGRMVETADAVTGPTLEAVRRKLAERGLEPDMPLGKDHDTGAVEVWI